MSEPTQEPFVPSYDTCNDVSAQCPLEATLYAYRPNLGGAIFFAIVFAICVICQIIFGIRMKGKSFAVWICVGVACEFAGYIARIALWNNPWTFGAMAAHLCTLVLAPSFVNAGISVTFKHIIIYCGEQHSKLKAKWYPIVFIGSDFASILIQVIGAALSATATSGTTDSQSLLDAANGFLIAGVSFQVANMVVCGIIILVFMWNFQQAKAHSDASCAYEQDQACVTRARFRMHCFCGGLATAYMAILARCCYRIPEMTGGWRGPLMQNEPLFLVMDGMMLAIACVALTIFHPMFFFHPMMRHEKQKVRAESSSETELRMASFPPRQV